MEYLLNAALFLLTFLGGILPIVWRSGKVENSDWFLSFGGAFLFAICFSHLIPESMHQGDVHWVSILILVGYLIQLFIQKFTHGIEHGHSCTHKHNATASWTLLIGMGLHSLIEGLPLSSGFFSISTLIPLYIAILMHKIPSAAIIGNIFYKQHQDRTKAMIVVAMFALITPGAALLGMMLSTAIESFYNIIPYIVPIVTGSFLQIATTIFYEHSSSHHKIGWKRWTAILIGVLLGIASGMSHTHHH